MPNLQDVAKLAGVSTATVSKVLSNTPYVSETTRQRVMNAVRTLGYRPNLAARALSSGKANIAGVVLPKWTQHAFQDFASLELLRGIEDVFSDHGYHLLLITPRIENGIVDESYSRAVYSGYCDGLLIFNTTSNLTLSNIAIQNKIPTVVIGQLKAPVNVYCDDFVGGYLAMQHLLSLGHRQIAVIQSIGDYSVSMTAWINGVQAALAEFGRNLDELPMAHAEISHEEGVYTTQVMVHQHPEITAVLTSHDQLAVGAIHGLTALGYCVPAQYSVVGYGNHAVSTASMPMLTTVEHDHYTLGKTAAQLLFSLLSHAEVHDQVFLPHIVSRQSTAVVP